MNRLPPTPWKPAKDTSVLSDLVLSLLNLPISTLSLLRLALGGTGSTARVPLSPVIGPPTAAMEPFGLDPSVFTSINTPGLPGLGQNDNSNSNDGENVNSNLNDQIDIVAASDAALALDNLGAGNAQAGMDVGVGAFGAAGMGALTGTAGPAMDGLTMPAPQVPMGGEAPPAGGDSGGGGGE